MSSCCPVQPVLSRESHVAGESWECSKDLPMPASQGPPRVGIYYQLSHGTMVSSESFPTCSNDEIPGPPQRYWLTCFSTRYNNKPSSNSGENFIESLRSHLTHRNAVRRVTLLTYHVPKTFTFRSGGSLHVHMCQRSTVQYSGWLNLESHKGRRQSSCFHKNESSSIS